MDIRLIKTPPVIQSYTFLHKLGQQIVSVMNIVAVFLLAFGSRLSYSSRYTAKNAELASTRVGMLQQTYSKI